ncbi:metallophosphoesterase [Halocatena pleomorpha]|uniref:Metallophosphoesterase n=1 Tax=Halocatena pleomorpha TaxID=1785090 RepID=A0A3P3R4B5_9EURY|nr:metallophosphoesterase [Halocatena pleomorpha]RRJ28174.1 metallophosphoesterase [Halocatena pleomorpha]
MASVEPVPNEPAAVAAVDSERALIVADYHAGIEIELRQEGVELPSRATDRRESVLSLLDQTNADRLIVLGDLMTEIGAPRPPERDELRTLITRVTERVPMTIVKGNHDGSIEPIVDAAVSEFDPPHEVHVTPTDGYRTGNIGFIHGHTWPSTDVLDADVIGMGHEHPMVRLTDAVGGSRTERVWLRGALRSEPFETHYGASIDVAGELVVFPAFNDLTGGTWTNTGQEFLAPYLPAGVRSTQAYLLNGTRLGQYDRI